MDFDKFPVPPLVPQPPAEPYPVATPPKEPPTPDMNQVREGFALEEAATIPPPSTPPPPLSEALPVLDFNKFPAPPLMPQPPAEPYPLAAPPKEPPPLLSGPLPVLDFDKFPVPPMVESERKPKKSLFSQIKDWLKARLSGSATPNSQNEAFGTPSTPSAVKLGIAESKAANLRGVIESQNPNTAKGSGQAIMSAQKQQELKEAKARSVKS